MSVDKAVLVQRAYERYAAGDDAALLELVDPDLEACTAAVRYELVGSGPAATRHQLKTESSEATVPLPAFVVARLRSHPEA